MHLCLVLATTIIIAANTVQGCLVKAGKTYENHFEQKLTKSSKACKSLCKGNAKCYKASYIPVGAYPPKGANDCFLYEYGEKSKALKTSTGYVCRNKCKVDGKEHVITATKTFVKNCTAKCTCKLDGTKSCVSLCPSTFVRCMIGYRPVVHSEPVAGTKCFCEKHTCEPLTIVEKKRQGGTLFLSCNTTKIDVIWTKNNLTVNTSNERIEVKKQSLVITDLKQEDNGVYQCGDGFTYKLRISKKDEMGGDDGGLATNVIIAISVAAAIILLILIVLITFCLHKRTPTRKTSTNRYVFNGEQKIPKNTVPNQVQRDPYESIENNIYPPAYETLQNASPKNSHNNKEPDSIYEIDYSKLRAQNDGGYILPNDTTLNQNQQSGYEVTYDLNDKNVKNNDQNTKNLDTDGYIDMNRLSRQMNEEPDYENAHNYVGFSH